MDKEITIVGKFYLKNGNIINEKITFDKDNNKEDVIKFIEEIKNAIKDGFMEKSNFQITFGFTIFRGSELIAVELKEEE